MIKTENFDFLIGKWQVHNRRLKERLTNCQQWEQFSATMETKPILNGLGLMDEMRTSYFGDEFVGLSVRILDPTNNQWTIYWADTAHPQLGLKEQVKGAFADGIGTFYGQEKFQEQTVKLRFIWKQLSDDKAQWEQAYFDQTRDCWETNWTMEFVRLP